MENSDDPLARGLDPELGPALINIGEQGEFIGEAEASAVGGDMLNAIGTVGQGLALEENFKLDQIPGLEPGQIRQGDQFKVMACGFGILPFSRGEVGFGKGLVANGKKNFLDVFDLVLGVQGQAECSYGNGVEIKAVGFHF